MSNLSLQIEKILYKTGQYTDIGPGGAGLHTF
jgi:hypothetical protein